MNAILQSNSPVQIPSWTQTWLSPKTGIIEQLIFEGADGTSSTLPICASALLRCPGPHRVGLGKGITTEEALVSAVGEALEIFASQQFQSASLLYESYINLENPSLDPRSLCLYEDSSYESPGFPYARFSENQPIHWVQGQWLATAEPVLVPALPTFRYFPAKPQERFCQVTSNGLAAGFDFRDAALRATLELIERDAFMLTWLVRLPQRELLFENCLAQPYQIILKNIRQFGAEIRLFVLKTDLNIPVVLAVAFGDGHQWPGAVIGTAAHITLQGAAEKAILELGQMGHSLRSAMRHQPNPIPVSPHHVHSIVDHGLYYIPQSRNSTFDFLRHTTEPPLHPQAEMEDHNGHLLEFHDPLDYVIHSLDQAHLRVAIVNLTTPELAQTPFTVVRALGENLQQIHFGHNCTRTNNPRLRHFLQSISPNSNISPLS